LLKTNKKKFKKKTKQTLPNKNQKNPKKELKNKIHQEV